MIDRAKRWSLWLAYQAPPNQTRQWIHCRSIAMAIEMLANAEGFPPEVIVASSDLEDVQNYAVPDAEYQVKNFFTALDTLEMWPDYRIATTLCHEKFHQTVIEQNLAHFGHLFDKE